MKSPTPLEQKVTSQEARSEGTMGLALVLCLGLSQAPSESPPGLVLLPPGETGLQETWCVCVTIPGSDCNGEGPLLWTEERLGARAT